MNTNDGGPAFPAHGSMGEVVEHGMSLRDYFAAKAMQAVMASDIPHGAEWCAGVAYAFADAMLKARQS